MSRCVFVAVQDGKTFKFLLKKKTVAARLVQRVAAQTGLEVKHVVLECAGIDAPRAEPVDGLRQVRAELELGVRQR